MWYDLQKQRIGQRLISTELKGRRTSQPTRKHPQIMKEKNLRATRSVAGTVEPDMAQGSVLHMAKHVTVVRDEIASRVCTDH